MAHPQCGEHVIDPTTNATTLDKHEKDIRIINSFPFLDQWIDDNHENQLGEI
jgi:hypothetical protein